MRRLIVALVAALLGLAACAPDHGTVTERGGPYPGDCLVFDQKSHLCTQRGPQKWQVCAANERESGCSYVDLVEYGNCPKGAAWPDCKK